MNGTTCLKNCPDGRYSSGAGVGTGVCIDCHPYCATCYGGSNTNCYSCKSPYLLLLNTNTCNTACTGASFPNTTTNRCDACATGCSLCTSLTYCTACTSTYFFLNNFCYNPCPPGYWGDTTTMTCKLCHMQCATCNNPLNTTCQSCNITGGFIFQAPSSCPYLCRNELV